MFVFKSFCPQRTMPWHRAAHAGAALSVALLGVACSSSAPPTSAEPRSAVVGGKRVQFGGTFDYNENHVIITANGREVMRYEFPPFTAVARMAGEVNRVPLTADCYFASILENKRGPVGMISRTVQTNVRKTTDTCRILENERVIETLNFPRPNAAAGSSSK